MFAPSSPRLKWYVLLALVMTMPVWNRPPAKGQKTDEIGEHTETRKDRLDKDSTTVSLAQLLRTALERWRTDDAIVLLEIGANPNARDSAGRTPLFDVYPEDEYDVELLLRYGADPNARDNDGCPFLHFALKHNFNPGSIMKLLDAGADPNTTWNGWTALDLVQVRDYDPTITDMLGNHGAISTGKGEIFNAIIRDDTTRLQRLLDAQPAFAALSMIDRTTPLHLAALKFPSTLARILIEHGAPVDALDNYHTTPLRWAFAAGNRNVVDLLLRHGADPTIADLKGRILSSEMIGDGISRYMDALTPSINWRSCLLNSDQAAILMSFDHSPDTLCRIMGTLLERGVTVDAVDYDDRTLLHHAALWEDPSMARLLLQHGATPNAVDLQGETPLHIAAKGSNPNLVRLLLDNGVDVDAQDSSGQTPLLKAVGQFCDERNCIACIRTLLQHGADPNVATASGDTPLHFAAEYKLNNAIELLLHYGARVDARNAKGETPLIRTFEYSLEKNGERDKAVCVRTLLNHGADPTIADDYGYTARSQAVAQRLSRVTALIDRAMRRSSKQSKR